MKLKKILGITGLAVASTVALAACGAGGNKSAKDDKTLTVGIMTLDDTTEPLWDKVKELAKDKGVTIELKEFTDYNQPNEALKNGEIDVNAFQHIYFLNNWNKENGKDLVAIADTYISPIRLYSGLNGSNNKYTKVEDIPANGEIAVPNDTTNEARALLLLQDNGLIKLKDGAGLTATVNDIAENPHNIKIVELEAAQVARVTGETAFVVLNGNYALQAGYSVKKDALAYEASDSEAAKTYVNIIAVKEGNEDSDAIKALVKVLKSDDIKKFIDEKYDGAVIAFE